MNTSVLKQVAQLLLGWPTVLPIADDLCKSSGALNIAMLIHRDRGVRIRIRISVPVRVNAVHCKYGTLFALSRKTMPNPNTKCKTVTLTLLGPVG